MIRKLILPIALLLLAAAPLLAFQELSLDSDLGGGEKPSGAYGGPSYLGVDVEDLSPERAQALKLSGSDGIEITMVDRDAPAGKAGLQAHDVILKFNNDTVESVEQIRRMLRETPAGRTVSLTIVRDGKQQQVAVTLARRKEEWGYSFAMPAMPPIPPIPPTPDVKIPKFDVPAIDVVVHGYSKTGLMVENITPQLREFFGAKAGEGVLVRSVEKGSTAESAGFKAGDIIVSLDNERISSLGDWRATLARKNGSVPVGIIRDRRSQTITLNVAKKDQSWVAPEGFEFDSERFNAQMAQLRPQLEELSKRMQSKEFQDEMRRAQQEIQRAMDQWRKEMQQEMRERQIELEKN